jgi:hypothetical protein
MNYLLPLHFVFYGFLGHYKGMHFFQVIQCYILEKLKYLLRHKLFPSEELMKWLLF